MRKFGLIGKKLGHSFSPGYFADKFAKLQISDAAYQSYELEKVEDVKSLIIEENLLGFNVTIPYKETIIPLLDKLSPEAKAIGAVNTVKKEADLLVGYNTDAEGFAKSIKPFFEPQHARALILGTGGASKAVAYVLDSLGVNYAFLTRNPKEAKQLSYQQASTSLISGCPFLINTTPLGMYPAVDDLPSIDYDGISKQHLLVDLIYNPLETLFLQEGKKRGAAVLNGLQMLQFQADAAWRIWNS